MIPNPSTNEAPRRTRRPIEREYLAALSDAVTLEDWREVIRATVTAAKEGDGKARDWLTRHLLGESPMTLTTLAADEAYGVDAEQDILGRMKDRQYGRDMDRMMHSDDFRKAEKQLSQHLRRLEAEPGSSQGSQT